jgi:hypothetical protein
MATALINRSRRLRDILERLSAQSVEDYYNPYKTFEWPESLPPGIWWMSPELMTTAGHELETELNIEQRQRLSRAESINFYSLNVHGIRELLIEVTRRIHTREFAAPSEYFHHFIGEENEHMWFFAEFCRRYGRKLYPNRAIAFPSNEGSPVFNNFLVFSRILIFEQIVDYFNSRMAADETLPETIRAINRVHHQDESRHIAFGCQLVRALFEQLLAAGDDAETEAARRYVERYIIACLQQLYNVDVYRDAGVADPFRFRSALLADPAREEAHQKLAERSYAFYRRIGVLE